MSESVGLVNKDLPVLDTQQFLFGKPADHPDRRLGRQACHFRNVLPANFYSNR